MSTIRVQAEDFDIGAELAALDAARAGAGAVVTFTGVVRGESGGRRLVAMTLEHYPGMTERELEAIESEARARWPLCATLVIHRHGRLTPGDNIVLVAVASAHRQAAFEAAAFLMDYLKSRAPFWKKEEFEGESEARWVDARESDGAAMRRWDRQAPRAAE